MAKVAVSLNHLCYFPVQIINANIKPFHKPVQLSARFTSTYIIFTTIHMAISAAGTTIAPPSFSLLRTHLYRRIHTTTPFPINLHNQRRRFALLSPRAFTVDVSGHLVQDAGASLLVVAGAYGLVSGFDYLTRRQIIEQVHV